MLKKWHRYKAYGTDGYNTVFVFLGYVEPFECGNIRTTMYGIYVVHCDYMPWERNNQYQEVGWDMSGCDYLGEVTEDEKRFIKMMLI
jgi:hypothetical protein